MADPVLVGATGGGVMRQVIASEIYNIGWAALVLAVLFACVVVVIGELWRRP